MHINFSQTREQFEMDLNKWRRKYSVNMLALPSDWRWKKRTTTLRSSCSVVAMWGNHKSWWNNIKWFTIFRKKIAWRN